MSLIKAIISGKQIYDNLFNFEKRAIYVIKLSCCHFTLFVIQVLVLLKTTNLYPVVKILHLVLPYSIVFYCLGRI